MTDISADTSTEASVAIGGSVTGEIETAHDKDWIAVDLVAGRTYQFDLQGAPSGMGTLADTFLRRIRDANGLKSVGDGRHRTYNDDFGGSRDSRVTFTATETGRYYVEVSGDRDETGTYTLTATDVTSGTDEQVVTPPHKIEGDDYAANTGTEGRVEAGGFTTGEIETAYDKDWIRVELVAGRTYQFDLQGAPSGMGTLADTFLRRIRDANGVKSVGDGSNRTYNDDFEGSRDSRVTFTPTESGTYYVEVSGDGDETGTYTLTVADVTPTPQTEQRRETPTPPFFLLFGTTPQIDHQLDDDEPITSLPQQVQESVTIPEWLTTLAPVEIGGSRGSWVGPGDPLTDGVGPNGKTAGPVTGWATGIAWFKVELTAGFPYRFEAAPRHNGLGALYFPTIEGVYDADGIPIAAAFSGAAVADVVPTASGTYYVAVGGQPLGSPTYLHGTDSGWVTLSATQTDDYGDSTTAPAAFIGQVTVDGGSSTGEIHYDGDVDWFAVSLTGGTQYRIDLKGVGAGTLADLYLRGVYDSAGNLIANTTDDNSGFLFNSRITFTPQATGTYYVAAGAVGDHTGTYRVYVSEVLSSDDFLATTATTGTVDVGGFTRGVIETVADNDWFSVVLKGGGKYRFDLEGEPQQAGTLDFPSLHIHGSDGNRVTVFDNASQIFRPQADGTYYAAVVGFNLLGDQSLGTYRLSVTELDDYPAAKTNAGTVTVGGSVTGRIHFAGDDDWFSVSLTEGTPYRIDLKGTHAGGGTLFDPYLGGVYDAMGDKVPFTERNDGGITYSARLDFTPETTGTYYIEASGAANHTGTYTLEVDAI